MRKSSALLALLLLPLLFTSTHAQDTEFHQTPPPKVPLAVEEAPVETVETPPSEQNADPGRVMEKIGAAWAREEAGEAAGDTSPGETRSDGEGDEGGDIYDGSILQSIMALSATLALLLLLFWALKKFGRRTPLLSGHTLGTVMGRIALSPQASLHFVRVKDEVLIVGVTQQSVTLLRCLEAELFEQEDIALPKVAENQGAPADFLSQLRTAQTTMQESPAGVDEELDNLKGDLQRLKQYFQDSARARE